jgi:hypothetical protein
MYSLDNNTSRTTYVVAADFMVSHSKNLNNSGKADRPDEKGEGLSM